jgi:hypothetical protein
VTAYPFNLRSIPNYNFFNPLSPLLPIALDALMYVFGFLSWRTVGVYDDDGQPTTRQGECHYLNRHVPTAAVEAEVERLKSIALSGGWASRAEEAGRWAFVTTARLRENAACLLICLSCMAYGVSRFADSKLPVANIVAVAWVIGDIVLTLAHERSKKIPRPPAHMMLVPTVITMLVAVLIFLLQLPNPPAA